MHSAIRTKAGFDNRLPGEFGWDISDTAGRFVRGKLDPIASLAVDIGFGTDYVGEPTELWGDKWYKPGKAIYSRLTPLLLSDIFEAHKNGGAAGVARSVPAMIFGVGTGNYPDRPERPETEAEKLAAKAERWGLASRDDADAPALRKIKTDLRARIRKGEDIDPRQALNDAVRAGQITQEQADSVTDRQVKGILSARTKTLLEDKAEGLKLDWFAKVLEAATPAERELLLPMAAKKMKEAEINGTLTPELQQRLEKRGAKILGHYPMPDEVRSEFSRFGISTPDVGDDVTLRGGVKRELDFERLDEYRRAALKAIYEEVQQTIKDPGYQKERDSAFQEKMLRRAVSRARERARRELKADLER
ncbi:MAG: hypothetical protein ACK4S4_11270 [Pyrinomonadaceae bacterium]